MGVCTVGHMIDVLVPHIEGVALLSDIPGIGPVYYDPLADLPPGTDAQVLVPPLLAGPAAVRLARRLPALELVQLLSAGAESWVGELPSGVALSDCRGAHGGATAEWIMAVLLAVFRGLPGFLLRQAEARWDQHATEELAGKQVLIVGAGDVAENLVRRLAPFEVGTTLVGRRARDGVHGIEEVLDLLPHHDGCAVTVPLTTETRGLVDARFLAAMPDGALLVNVARGPVVDTDALVAELMTGRLRAAVDVTDPEPLPGDHPLWRAPGVLITPHVAASGPTTVRRAYAVAATQIGAFARGEKPSNLVENEY